MLTCFVERKRVDYKSIAVITVKVPTTCTPTSAELSEELDVSYQTVLDIRRDLQANAAYLQPDTPLPDHVTESDEMFQNAGEKRR